VPEPSASPPPVADIAAELAYRLETHNCDYALGGAIALASWAEPRGTIDVDVSFYLSVQDPRQTIDMLRKIGAEYSEAEAVESLTEHGFCRVKFLGRILDVFLPIASIYDAARPRRRRMPIANREAYVWDAETLCVFKMMFFRRKDLADVEAVLRNQGASLDRSWVEQQLLTMYGQRDPRVNQWRELAAESQA
jgi:hypothetical protein